MRNLIGERFGRLVVIKQGGRTNQNAIKWVCQCDCGNTKEVSIGHLTNGDTKSCGCLAKEYIGKLALKHGHSKNGVVSAEYYAWKGMNNRCYNEKYYLYHRYGGRGIKVCDRWLESFENFYEDMGDRPSNKYSLDRINNDGNYEPSNCRWATQKQQSSNKENNKWIEYGNKKMIQSEWARELNIENKKLHYYLKTWNIADIVDMVNNGGIINKRKKPYNKTYYPNNFKKK